MDAGAAGGGGGGGESFTCTTIEKEQPSQSCPQMLKPNEPLLLCCVKTHVNGGADLKVCSLSHLNNGSNNNVFFSVFFSLLDPDKRINVVLL